MKQPFMGLKLNLITIVLTILLSVTSVINCALSNQMQNIHADKTDLIFSANQFMTASIYLTDEVRAYAATGDKTHYDNYWNEVTDLQNREDALQRMNEIGLTDKEFDIISEMSTISNDLGPKESNAMSHVENGDMEFALQYVYSTEYTTSSNKIHALSIELLDEIVRRTSHDVDTIELNHTILQTTIFFYSLVIVSMQIVGYLKNKVILCEIDTFSGLYNRNKYMQVIAELIERKSCTVGIVHLDINGLNQINNEYGHEYGDSIIIQVVNTLKSYFSDNIFRIGGDEFALLFVKGSHEVFDEKVLQLRAILGVHTNIGVSIGSTWCPDPHDILRQTAHADELMYIDKRKYYTASQNNKKDYRSITASELQQSIAAKEFTIWLIVR